MIDGSYVYLPLATLQTLQAQCLACLQDNFQAHQSYSIAGRTITRANIGQVSVILQGVSFAIDFKNGTSRRTTVANFRCH